MLKTYQSAKYRSLGLVGQGQFGQVYCAIHRKSGRLVALKNLNRDRFPTHQFLREFRFLLSLDHPHIANCLALDQSGSGRQLVLDYCEGGTLRDLMEQGTQLTLAEILTLTTEILSALEHAHAKGLIHCDIKPENILLSLSPHGWRAKVSDFGIARLSQEYQGKDKGATGSPAYMAPERFYFQFSAASDLYAVGIMLYELLLGDRPFSGNYNQLMVCHLNHAVKLPDSLPVSIQAILKKATEKLTPRRYRSATDMKAAILKVRKTLTAGDLRERFPKIAALKTVGSFAPQEPVQLPDRCSALALLNATDALPQLLTAHGHQLYGWSLTNTQTLDSERPAATWDFDAPITQLCQVPSGVLVVTQNQLHLLTTSSLVTLATFNTAIAVLPGGQQWAIVQSLASPRRLWAVNTHHSSPIIRELPTEDEQVPTTAAMLDDRHYAIASQQDKQSHLHVLSRKGQSLGKVSVQTNIHHLFASQKPGSCIALAGTKQQDFLVIRIKPYRIMRCRLDIVPHWFGELVTGYVAISQKGEMRLINYYGQLIGQINDLPIPEAVCFHPPHGLWIVSQQGQDTCLHHIDLQALGLDLIF
ncbi:serine/threonine-protein kinase [Leptolyngbya iicbica]|uniref:Serine/threonine protein kinase n=1 Tax=Lyngbya confervoides BDU141951 TaxID=1574623 RepID=A0A8T6QWD5_9CYAN|nr:serine/threonine-protein kinase [Leptolyngbya sp. LK]